MWIRARGGGSPNVDKKFLSVNIINFGQFANLPICRFAYMNGSQTDEPLFCKLCGIGISDKNAINQHMINHVEAVLKEDFEAKESINEVIQKLDIITENEAETISGKELDKEEEDDFESFMKEFDADGNRIS